MTAEFQKRLVYVHRNEKDDTRSQTKSKDRHTGDKENLLITKIDLSRSIEKKQQKMDEYRLKLEKDGSFYEVKIDMLRRYLALKNIHSDL